MCAFCFSHKSSPTVTPCNTIVSSLLVAALVAVTSPASANVLIFTDPSNADANWTIVNQSGFVSAGFQATGGNPSNTSYRQITLSGTVMFVGELNNTFVYNPSVQGAITGITYNADFETLNAAGSSYFPLVSQNGSFYIENSHGMNASANTWLNQNLVTDLTQFVLLQVTNGIATFDFTKHPDFSAAGSSIDFGYEAVAGGAGPFTSITGMANDPITVTFTPLVSGSETPLPGALPLFAGGLGVFGLLARRRKREHSTKQRLVVLSAACFIALATTGKASAVTIYSFTGGNFDTINRDDPLPAGSYTTAMKVTGSFTVAAPFAPNLTFFDILPTSLILDLSFSDGRQTIDLSNFGPTAFGSAIQIATDSLGAITSFDIGFATVPPTVVGGKLGQIIIRNITVGLFDECLTVSNGACDTFGIDQAFGPGGVLELTSTDAQTPLLATLPLFTSGLCVMGLLGWRRKSKAAAAA
jgi:hypothetical protein